MSLPLYVGIGLGIVLATDYLPTVVSVLSDKLLANDAGPPLPPLHEGYYRQLSGVDPGDSVMYAQHRDWKMEGKAAEAQGVAVQSGDQVAVQTLRSIIDGTPGVVPLGQHYTYGYKGMYPTFFKDFKQSIEKACGGKVELGAGMPQMYLLTGDHQTFEECRGALFDDIGDFADPQITVYTGESHL